MELSFTGIIFGILYLSFCLLFFPLRAWKKGFKKRSVFFSLISIFVLLICSLELLEEFRDENSGYVIFAPAFCLYIQFIFNMIFAFFVRINKPRVVKFVDK